MQDWKTMVEVAKELEVSKDLVKYHKGKMPSEYWRFAERKVLISPEGVEYIRGRLRKEKYDITFEEQLLSRVRVLEQYVNTNYHLLLQISNEISELKKMADDY